MIHRNLKQLRHRHHYTQEYVAEQVNVSRQSIAKWEKGESVPDLMSCIALAKFYEVTLDNLVHFDDENMGIGIPPKGKHFLGTVTINKQNQIEIPKKACTLFHLQVGDTLMLVGDEERGMALVPQQYLTHFFSHLHSTQKKEQNDGHCDSM